MAKTIALSKMQVDDLDSVGFFIIAPHLDKRRNRNTNLEDCIHPESICSAVNQRIAAYVDRKRDEVGKLRKWENDYVQPLVNRLCSEKRLKVLCWDESLEAITKVNPSYGGDLKRFYERCLSFEPPFAASIVRPRAQPLK